jgi:hypothetical protein
MNPTADRRIALQAFGGVKGAAHPEAVRWLEFNHSPKALDILVTASSHITHRDEPRRTCMRHPRLACSYMARIDFSRDAGAAIHLAITVRTS